MEWPGEERQTEKLEKTNLNTSFPEFHHEEDQCMEGNDRSRKSFFVHLFKKRHCGMFVNRIAVGRENFVFLEREANCKSDVLE